MRFEGIKLIGNAIAYLPRTTYEVTCLFVAFLVLHTKYICGAFNQNVDILACFNDGSTTYRVNRGLE